MLLDSFKERWFFMYWTEKLRNLFAVEFLTCDSEVLSVINEMTPKPERVQERKMVFLWCITEFLAPVNQVKSRPCICHHLQTHISLMLSEAQVEMLPGFGFILKTLCPQEKCSGVIRLCRGRWLQRFRILWIYDICRLQVQKQLEMKIQK